LEESVRGDKGKTVTKKKSLLESLPALVLLGVLAGAIGGLGIGFIQFRAMNAAASTATGK